MGFWGFGARRSTAPPAWPPSAATRSRRSRSGAPRRATPAIRSTATSTGTSASTCRSTTSATTSTRRTCAASPGSSTTPSPTTSCTTSGSTIRQRARERVGLHAAHFRGNRARQVEALASRMDRPPIVRGPLRRRALRPLVVRGAALPRRPLPPAGLRPGRGGAHLARRLPASATPPTRWSRPRSPRGGSRATASTGATRPTPGSTATSTWPGSGWSSWRGAARTPRGWSGAPSTRRRASSCWPSRATGPSS